MSINERTFRIAENYVKSLGYDGPVALSCDDTKLHPAYRTYWDAERQMHFLVGGTGDPIAIASVEELRSVISDGKIMKASKVRSLSSVVWPERLSHILNYYFRLDSGAYKSPYLRYHR